jgi:mannose-6-phosphate isomerase-like protein (cupin superfamily)
MADYSAKRISDMETKYGGGFVLARAELGATAFGFQVIQMPPDFSDYPDHDHAETNQEEVFAVLGGSGWMEIEGERVEMEPEMLIRVGATTKRKVIAGPQGIRMLVIGGSPGEAYTINPETELTGASA